MALTSEEKKMVLDMLDELDREEINKVLASLKAFANWLKETAFFIYNKVKDVLQSLWQSICNFFSSF